MSGQSRIVIIGGTACGPKAAARARRCDPDAKITLIEQGDDLSSATCGLPYFISGVIRSKSSLVTRQPDYFRNVMDMEVLTQTRALSIDREAHEVEVIDLATDKRATIGYDKLVLATGSVPAVPDLPGRNLKGIFTLATIQDANSIRSDIADLQTKGVAIAGAGLIGMEMAEAFASQGMKVTVIEALDWPLPALLDAEVAAHVGKHLGEKGVNLLFGQRVTGFEGDRNGRVRRVLTGNMEIEAGLVLVALGARPNVSLAREAGLVIGATGGISISPQLQTSDPDIYAGGDCVENVNLITGKPMLSPMGSTANKHGRIIGSNVTGGSETFPGVLGTGVAKVFDYNVARTGLGERQAQAAGYDTVISLVAGGEHAGYYPGSRDILVKLIAEKPSGRLLGGQVVGPGDTAKRIDVLATALSCRATVDSLANLDLAYAPPYNSAMDPLHHAANVIRNKLSGHARALSPAEVKKKLASGDDFILLDVRSLAEWKTSRLEDSQVKLIPLPELRSRLGELPREKEIVIFCWSSVRAYQAQRILDGAGFENVSFMDGSLAAWPYDVYEA